MADNRICHSGGVNTDIRKLIEPAGNAACTLGLHIRDQGNQFR